MIQLTDLLKEGKTPITVFRIENSEGLGPFREEVAELIKNKNIDDYKIYKQIYNRISKKHAAVIVNVPKGYVFGYESLSQLKNWFDTADLALLKKYGFNVKKYNNIKKYYDIMDRELIFKK